MVVAPLLYWCSPPINRTSPDWRPQQIWCFLCSTRLTDNASNVETPSNFSQDLNVESSGPPKPPQRRLLQKLAEFLPRLIRFVGHDSFENGLSFSVGRDPAPLDPATMIKPPVNSWHINILWYIFYKKHKKKVWVFQTFSLGWKSSSIPWRKSSWTTYINIIIK